MVNALLRQILDAGGDRRPLRQDEMERIARSVRLDRLDLEGFRCFQEESYARNQVHLNEHFELVVICWKAGQASSIHDHASSRCLYLVVEGEMEEERFELDAQEQPQPFETRSFAPGKITVAVGPEIHRIRNYGPAELVTVHLYSPPIGPEVRNFTAIPRRSMA